MSIYLSRGFLAVGLLFAYIFSGQTFAQSEEELDEIIVTATKREERLQDVPMTVNVVSQESIEIQGIRSAQQLAIGVPGLDYQTPNRGANASFIVRGIATAVDDQNQVNKTVSLYIDELPLTSSNSAINPEIGLMDVSRVEVLKGPQGTLFGSGTLGGVVRVVTNKPDTSGFDSSLGLDVGMTDGERSTRVEGMINIPISDSVAFRFAGFMRDGAGYVQNTGLGTDPANGQNDHGIRASLAWDINENLSASFMMMSQETDNDDASPANPALGGRFSRTTVVPETQQTEVNLYNMTINYETEFADFVFSSSKSETDTSLVNDLSDRFGGAFPFLQNRRDQEDNTVNEIRVVSNGDGRFQWVLGYFDLERESEFNRHFGVTQAYVDSKGGTIGGLVDVPGVMDNAFIYGAADKGYINLRTNIDRESALFAEMSYQLTTALKGTIGLRSGEVEQYDDSRAGGSSNLGGFIGGVVFQGGTSFTPEPYASDPFATGQQDADTMKFSLAWQVSDETNLYISASEGFRGPVVNGGCQNNGGVSTLDANDIVIPCLASSDSLWMYEVGMKGLWNDGALTANAALYQIDWEDIQMVGNRVSDAQEFTSNVDGAELNGIEFELTNSFSDEFMMGLNMNLSNQEISAITQYQMGFSGAEMGSSLVGPERKFSAFAQYNRPMDDGNEVVVRADMQYVGEMPNTFPNEIGDPDTPATNYQMIPSYTNLNASLGYVTENWSVSLYAENILDNDDWTFVGPTIFQNNRFKSLTPRTFGVRVTLR